MTGPLAVLSLLHEEVYLHILESREAELQALLRQCGYNRKGRNKMSSTVTVFSFPPPYYRVQSM